MTAVNVTEEMTLTKPNRAKGSMPWTAKIYDKKQLVVVDCESVMGALSLF